MNGELPPATSEIEQLSTVRAVMKKAEEFGSPLVQKKSDLESISKGESVSAGNKKLAKEQLKEEGLQTQVDHNSAVWQNLNRWEYYLQNTQQVEEEKTALQSKLAERRNALACWVGAQKSPPSAEATQQMHEEFGINASEQELVNFEQTLPNELRETGQTRILSLDSSEDSEVDKMYRANLPAWQEIGIKAQEQFRKQGTTAEQTAQKENADLKIQLAAEKARADAAEEKNKQLVAAAAEKDRLNRELADKIERQNAEIERLKQESARKDREKAELQKQFDEAQAAMRRLLNNTPITDEEIAGMKDETSREIYKKFKEKDGQIKNLTEKNSQLEAENRQLREQLENPVPPEENWQSRLRGFAEGIFGVGTGIVTTEGAALGALALFPGLGPVAYLEGSLTGTAAWLTAEVLSTRRNLEARYPRLARFVRNATIGSVATTLANTALTAMEGAGITHFINRPEIVQAAAPTVDKVTPIIKDVIPPAQILGQHTVTSGENIWNIVKETHHLKDNHEIARQTVDNILQNLNALRADATKFNNTGQLNALQEIHGLTTKQVMKNEELFRRVMDAGRSIHVGTKLMIK